MVMEGEGSLVVVSETIAALRSNHFDALYVKSGKQALRKILERIPLKAIVGAGDSLTLKQIGVFEELERRGYQLFWPFHESVPKSRRTDVARKALLADIFLTGSNAVTMDGKIVNVDSSGNRVAGMIFGPKKVIIVVGVNKIVENVEKAFERIRKLKMLRRLSRGLGMLRLPQTLNEYGRSVGGSCCHAWRLVPVWIVMRRTEYATSLPSSRRNQERSMQQL